MLEFCFQKIEIIYITNLVDGIDIGPIYQYGSSYVDPTSLAENMKERISLDTYIQTCIHT